jgi:hypothetical protein
MPAPLFRGPFEFTDPSISQPQLPKAGIQQPYVQINLKMFNNFIAKDKDAKNHQKAVMEQIFDKKEREN